MRPGGDNTLFCSMITTTDTIQGLQCQDLYELNLLLEDASVDVEYVAGVLSQKAEHRSEARKVA